MTVDKGPGAPFINQDSQTPENFSKTALIVVPEIHDKRSKHNGPDSHLSADFQKDSSHTDRSDKEKIEEIIGLAEAISLSVVSVLEFNVRRPAAASLFGKGQLETVAQEIESVNPDVVIINHVLSPVQQRNLEKRWNAKVIDRTGLILEIFGERAQTKEGKLQVELATLKYARSRLVRSWTHLERQRGGLGFVGGPGETQLELDKRLINERIDRLEKDLEQVRKTRHLQRKRREQSAIPVISLVGYTNAGKSTLFNRLTGESIFAKNLLFATLDPTVRQIDFSEGEEALISDTVGFISDLPTDLIAAFRATLEQIQYADVILHVRDISSEDTDAQAQDVANVLDGLGIHYNNDNRVIEAWNKIDLVEDNNRQALSRKAGLTNGPPAVIISAVSGEGLEDLKNQILETIHQDDVRLKISLPSSEGRAMSWLHSHARVLNKKIDENTIEFIVDIDQAGFQKFKSEFPELIENHIVSIDRGNECKSREKV